MDNETVERARLIIANFLRVEEPAEELKNHFQEWLLDDTNRLAKDEALWQVFEEIFEENAQNKILLKNIPVADPAT